ncbi:MAG: AAA family ATPase [Chloroflexota bacterium]|nr:AAA family ATPase [Chloroflexota bacterium]
MRTGPPILVFLIGPAAVGKMTVGAALAARTGLKLFHNHQTIDLVLPYFTFGSPPFDRLVTQFRRRIFEEIAESDLPGLIFTYVWAFDQPADEADVERYASVFLERGGSVHYVELQASQRIRLERNATPYRLERKPFKRDIEASRRNLISMDESHQLDSRGRFADRKDWLRIDNSELSPEEAAEMVIAHFGLPTVSPRVVI